MTNIEFSIRDFANICYRAGFNANKSTITDDFDCYKYLASLLTDIDYSQITYIQRKFAKLLVFGSMWGKSEQNMIEEYPTSDSEKLLLVNMMSKLYEITKAYS